MLLLVASCIDWQPLTRLRFAAVLKKQKQKQAEIASASKLAWLVLHLALELVRAPGASLGSKVARTHEYSLSSWAGSRKAPPSLLLSTPT